MKRLIVAIILGALLFTFIAPIVSADPDKATKSGESDAPKGGEEGFSSM